jgi:hypothetical protein
MLAVERKMKQRSLGLYILERQREHTRAISQVTQSIHFRDLALAPNTIFFPSIPPYDGIKGRRPS